MKSFPDFSNPFSSTTQRKNAIWFVLIIIIIATAIIIRNSYVRFEEHTTQQDNLVKNSISGAAREITLQISELRRGIKLLAHAEHELLARLAKDPEDIDSYETLVKRVKEDFPEAFAVTVADAEGVPYIVDFDGFIVDICKRDIKNFAAQKHPPEIFIHPNPFVYHFDIMVPVNLVDHGESFFFVSFEPSLISRLLANSQLYNHRLILLKNDRPGLVEITADGSRQNLQEEEFFLSEEQYNNLAYSTPVAGTSWNLVNLPVDNDLHAQLIRHGTELVTQILILIVLSYFMVRQLTKSEHRIVEQNIFLTQQAHALKKNEARLERAQHIANMGYWDYNLATDQLELSEGGRNIFGFTADQALSGERILHNISPEDRGKVKTNMAGAILRKRPYHSEFQIISRDHKTKIVYASAELTTDSDGNPLHLFGIVQDITERRHAENTANDAVLAKLEADAANEAKSCFLANMSHEIRTPLTAIIGFAESLLESNQSMAERSSSIKTIIRNGKHLAQIINDILDLSKIEANKLEIERVPLSVFHLISEVDSIIRPIAQDKELDFQIHYQFPLPLLIVSEPLRLKQILINLCSNAIKFTRHGHVYLTVACDTSAEKMIFSIEDTGIGLTPEQMDRIFNPFTQADSSTTREFGGTGLGLSLSNQLAQLLGGSLEVMSQSDIGSIFTLTVNSGALTDVDMIDDQKYLPVTDSAPVVAKNRTLVAGKILLAEDTPDNQRLISMQLTKMGAEVDIVENGQMALDYANNKLYDLILMDVQMPVMDGIEAVKLLRASGYVKPIVALTANAMKDDRDKCLSAGCNDYLTKPVNQDNLAEIVKQYCKTINEKPQEQAPIFSQLLMEDPDYEDLVKRFVSNLPETMQKIKDYFINQQYDDFRMAIHKLKGTGGGFGYPQLSALAAKIEFQQTSENFAEVARLMDELANLCARIYSGIFGTTITSHVSSA